MHIDPVCPTSDREGWTIQNNLDCTVLAFRSFRSYNGSIQSNLDNTVTTMLIQYIYNIHASGKSGLEITEKFICKGVTYSGRTSTCLL